jgi:hypothetical protein
MCAEAHPLASMCAAAPSASAQSAVGKRSLPPQVVPLRSHILRNTSTTWLVSWALAHSADAS